MSATRSRLPSRPRGASPRRAPRRPHLPGALPQLGRAASPTWRLRRASRTSRRAPAPLGSSSAGAGGRRETLLGRRRCRLRRQAADSEPVAQPVTAAPASRRRLSPTTTWRPQPPQEAGGRGGRRRAGQLTARPSAAGHRLPHSCEPEMGAGAAPRAPGPRTPLAWSKCSAVPSGRPRSSGPAACHGAAKTHPAPPPRGDMLRLGGAFPATADPAVSGRAKPQAHP